MLTKHQVVGFMKVYVPALLLFLSILSPALWASADHNKGTYPSYGIMWISADKDYSGYSYFTSENCNSAETGAASRIEDSTTGTAEMSDWDSGIQLTQYTCTGNWNYYTDMKFHYLNHPGSPGENHDDVASSAFCSFWNESYPCGMRPDVHFDTTWWNNASQTSRERLVMHETGHSFGLSHHCSEDAIMNDGSGGCNGGAWTSVMEYQSTDREGIDSVY
jgi:hypothetical protein